MVLLRLRRSICWNLDLWSGLLLSVSELRYSGTVIDLDRTRGTYAGVLEPPAQRQVRKRLQES